MMTRYKVDDWEYPIIGLVLIRYISDTFSDYSVLHKKYPKEGGEENKGSLIAVIHLFLK